MRIRQIAFVARELAPVEEALTGVLGIETAFRDPGVGKYGLENAVMPLGDSFLEVVAPVQEGTTAGRYLDRRGGDGGYMVILQVDDVESDRAHVAKLGIRVVEQIDRPGAKGTHLHPKDVPGAILSLDAMEPAEEWKWAGPDWRQHVRTNIVSGIRSADIAADDPGALAVRWSEVLRRPVSDEAGVPVIMLDDNYLRFVPVRDDRGEGLCALTLSAPGRGKAMAAARERDLPVKGWSVRICGVDLRLD